MDLSGIFDFFGNGSSTDGMSTGLAINDMFGGGNLRQAKLAKEQMDWQSDENQKDRIHQLGVMGLQNMFYKDQADYDYMVWKNQMDLINAYNTPEQQIKRLEEAGINPNVIFPISGAAPAAGGMSSASPTSRSPQIPTGGSSHSVSAVPGISGTGSPGIGIINSITAGLRQVAEAKKLGMDTQLLEDSYDALIRKNFADAMQAENQANITSMSAEVQRANLPWDKKRGLYDTILKLSESERAFAQADEANKDAALKDVQKIGADLENQFKQLRLNHGEEIVRLEMNNLRAQANRDNASAEESRANAAVSAKEEEKLEKTIPWIVKNIKVDNKKAIEELQNMRLDNLEDVLRVTDHALGLDSGKAAQLKGLLYQVSADRRIEVVNSIIKMLEDANK